LTCQSVVLLYSEVFSIFNIYVFYYTGSSIVPIFLFIRDRKHCMYASGEKISYLLRKYQYPEDLMNTL
ncbi:hypothetical protein, partial [Blautia faecis]